MWHFLGTRLAMGFLTIWVTTVLVTLLIHLVPGDPVQIMYAQSQGTTPEQIEEVRRSLGLDRPIPIQYLMYMERLFQGDLGVTIRGGQPVLEVIAQRLPNTLMLAVTAMFIAAYRQPSKFQREEKKQHQSEPEMWHRYAGN